MTTLGELSFEPEQMTGFELDQAYREQVRTTRRSQAREAVLLAEIDRRRSFEPDGYRSTTSYVKHAAGKAGPVASREVKTARALRHMPKVTEAFLEGDLSDSRVWQLARTRDIYPTMFTPSEPLLVSQAKTLSARQFRYALGHWKQAADPEQFTQDHKALRDRRTLSVSATYEGMVRIDGTLDPVGGQVVLDALRSHADPANLDKTDTRTPTQVRADALVDICRDRLEHGDTPIIGGEKPQVTLIVDLQTLVGGGTGRAELADAGVITAEQARQICCDAGISRIITNGPSEILDVGRRTRSVTPAMRRALVLRDGGCQADGCDIAARWCDAHHLHHWADGGDTNLANLVLLCRRHHTAIHEGDIRLPDRE